VPQLVLPWSGQTAAATAVPGGSGVQVPAFPVRLHEAQVPQDALAQQTPSAHIVLRHSEPAVQAAPSTLRLVQLPDWQVYPVTQSAGAVQVARQVIPPHCRCPGQVCGVCTQVPAPSQAPTGVAIAPVQVAVPQLAPALVLRQAPAPLQVPSNPQGGLAAQRWCGSALPPGTGWHEPAFPVRLQTWQLPQLGAEQQTPSTQLPLEHSVPAEQICPSRFSPHEPPTQNSPGAQSVSPVQTATHVSVAALQANGKQGWVDAVLQTPAPSQVRARVAVVDPDGQLGGAHWMPAG